MKTCDVLNANPKIKHLRLALTFLTFQEQAQDCRCVRVCAFFLQADQDDVDVMF